MRMKPLEKKFLNKFCAVSGKEVAVVRDVLRSVLIGIVLEVYGNNNEVIIPYIGTLKISKLNRLTDEGIITKIKINLQPADALVSEIMSIYDGHTAPSENWIRKQILKNIQGMLDINVQDDMED